MFSAKLREVPENHTGRASMRMLGSTTWMGVSECVKWLEGGVGVRYLGVGTLMNDADVFPAIFPEFDAVVYGPGIEIVEGL